MFEKKEHHMSDNKAQEILGNLVIFTGIAIWGRRMMRRFEVRR